MASIINLILCVKQKLKIKPLVKIICNYLRFTYLQLFAICELLRNADYLNNDQNIKLIKQTFKYDFTSAKAIIDNPIAIADQLSNEEFVFANVIGYRFCGTTQFQKNITLLFNYKSGDVKPIDIKIILDVLQEVPDPIKFLNLLEKDLVKYSLANCEEPEHIRQFFEITNYYCFTKYIRSLPNEYLLDFL